MLYRPEGGEIGLGLLLFWLLPSSIWSSLALLSVYIKHQARRVSVPVASTGRGQGIESHSHLATSAFEMVVSPSRKLGGQGNVRLRKTQRGGTLLGADRKGVFWGTCQDFFGPTGPGSRLTLAWELSSVGLTSACACWCWASWRVRSSSLLAPESSLLSRLFSASFRDIAWT